MLNGLRNASISVLLGLWAAVMAFVCATLMIGHWVPLPSPQVGASQILPIEPSVSKTGNWKAVHFLYMDCPCSRRILSHLSKREPLQNLDEMIVCIGESCDDLELFSESHFKFDWTTPRELRSKYNVESAPLLVVLDPENTIRYSGAYTSRKQGFDIQDVSIIARTRDGKTVPSLLLFGCGVSKELSSITDPLALKRLFSNSSQKRSNNNE